MLQRGRGLARERGVAEYINFIEGDIKTWCVDNKFSVCIASQALHHMLDLEILFEKIKNAIHPNGIFLTNDMIGRNGHMRWPEALRIPNDIWARMPDRYKYNHQLKRFERKFENWDCSKEGFEGIRAQDILSLLMKNFHFEVFLAFSNLITVFIDRSFGHNFDNIFDIQVIYVLEADRRQFWC